MFGTDWTRLQPIAELELLRKYRFSQQYLPLLFEHIRVDEGTYVADVGCGTGHLSRQMALAVGKEGHVFAIDRDSGLLQRGYSIATQSSLCSNISFLSSDVYNIALEDNSVDVAVSVSLFVHLKNHIAAIKEIARILRPGGYLSIIEGTPFPATKGTIDLFENSGYPDDTSLIKHFRKIDEAWCEHAYPRVTKDLDIASNGQGLLDTLPSVMKNAGLKNIEINGHFSVSSLADARIEDSAANSYINEYFDYLEELVDNEWLELKAIDQTTTKIKNSDVNELKKLLRKKRNYLRENIHLLKENLVWNGTVFLISTGQKETKSLE